MIFYLTERAAKKIVALKKGALRVRIDPVGCFGFQYLFSFEKKALPEDLKINQKGACVLLDPVSQGFLDRATLDYKDEMIGSSFVVENPNSTSNCGCKTSFSIG